MYTLIPIVCILAESLIIATGLARNVPVTPAFAKVQIIKCVEGEAELPALFIAAASRFPNLDYRRVPEVPKLLGAGVYEIDFHLPQGNYFFKAESSKCSNSTQAAVISGHTRTLSMPTFQRVAGALFGGIFKEVPNENALGGAMPIRPDLAYLESANGKRRYLDLQDGMYYIEKVIPGLYSLRLEFHGGFESDISLDLRTLSRSDFVQRDLSIPEIKRNMGNFSPSGKALKTCEFCY
jgi:hypothetical protein